MRCGAQFTRVSVSPGLAVRQKFAPYSNIVRDLEVTSGNLIVKTPATKPCHVKWKWVSPTTYVLNSMIQYMFLAALDAGNETNATQVFDVNRAERLLIFHSDYSYLAGALVVMVLELNGALLLLWGWWELDR